MNEYSQSEQPQQKKKISRQIAVALQYDMENDPAPAIIAKGQGSVAKRILTLAEKHNIPIHEDRGLAESLGQLSIGDHIPPDLFPAIAEVLAFIYRMNNHFRP